MVTALIATAAAWGPSSEANTSRNGQFTAFSSGNQGFASQANNKLISKLLIEFNN
jgi:hypothetical protein